MTFWVNFPSTSSCTNLLRFSLEATFLSSSSIRSVILLGGPRYRLSNVNETRFLVEEQPPRAFRSLKTGVP